MVGCPDEDVLLGLGRGALAAAARDDVLRHLDDCDACRRAAAAAASASPVADDAGRPGAPVDDAAAPARVGRYELREPLGAGAMGIVFVAHDPALDRRIAVKLLRRELGDDDGRGVEQRLVAEARALARLAHPNVIAAYEVGRHDGEVFLAMELVEGGTLRDWLDAAARTRREIVAAFLQAGEGLAAAHAAGIVHRDFKPENILVGRDGRVRVTDFGLASGALIGGAVAEGGARSGGVALTRTGALAGTPAFMAPEQLEGAAASERSDQYAFAVALWTALWGVRPYGGDTVPVLLAAARAGAPRTAPRRDVPARLRAALERALAPDAAARWPAMRPLLDALAPHARPSMARRRAAVVAAVGVIAAATAVAAVAIVGDGPSAHTCPAEPAAGMWDPAQRDAVAAAFHAASPDVAPAVTAAVDAAMVRFRDRWAAARVDACRLGAAGAARASCLDVLRIQADTLVGLLRRADAALVDSAVVAAARLPDPATCARPPAPVAEAQQAQVRALDGRLAELRALASAQRSAEAEALATEIYEEATAAGLDRIRASALSWRGSIQPLVDGGEGRELADFRQALAIATSIGDDVVAAEVLGGLSYAYSQQGRHDLADLIDLLHASTLTAIGGDPVQEASRAVWACQRAWIRGEGLEDGLRRCHDARRQLIAAVGEDDYRLPELDVETGNVLYMLGRYEEAIVAYRTANEGFVRLFGPRTVRVHAALGNMADTQIRLGRPAEAIATLEALVARDPAPPFWDALALARRQLGELDEALEAHRQGARSAIAMDRPSLRCQAEVGAAEVLLQLGRDVEATRTHRGAEEVCAGEIGSLVDRGRLGWVRARLLARGGDLRGARRARDVTLALLADAGVGNPAGELRAQVEAWDPVTERATP